MTNEKSSALENLSFRYLLEDDIANPHYHIVAFYGCDHHIEIFRYEINNLIKTSCSTSFYGDRKRFYSSHHQLTKLIELAFVLKETNVDLILGDEHELSRTNKGPFIWHEDNMGDLAGAGLNLRVLDGHEINNVQTVFEGFFAYKSLDEWYKFLDDVLLCAEKKSILNREQNKSYEIIFVKEYLEKLIEAMFLVYNTTSLPYAKLNYASDFGFNSDEEVSGSNLPDKDLTKPFSQPELVLSEALEEALIDYFRTFCPRFVARNLRRVFLSYVENILEIGSVNYTDELRSFIYQLDQFYELLDLAEKETAHWPQINRIGKED